jgi:hypothetical protein
MFQNTEGVLLVNNRLKRVYDTVFVDGGNEFRHGPFPRQHLKGTPCIPASRNFRTPMFGYVASSRPMRLCAKGAGIWCKSMGSGLLTSLGHLGIPSLFTPALGLCLGIWRAGCVKIMGATH